MKKSTQGQCHGSPCWSSIESHSSEHFLLLLLFLGLGFPYHFKGQVIVLTICYSDLGFGTVPQVAPFPLWPRAGSSPLSQDSELPGVLSLDKGGPTLFLVLSLSLGNLFQFPAMCGVCRPVALPFPSLRYIISSSVLLGSSGFNWFLRSPNISKFLSHLALRSLSLSHLLLLISGIYLKT